MIYRNKTSKTLKLTVVSINAGEDHPDAGTETLEPEESLESYFPADMIVIEEVDKPEALQ